MRTPSPSRPPPAKRAPHPSTNSPARPPAPSDPARCPSPPMPRWLKSAVLRCFVSRGPSLSGSSPSSCSSSGTSSGRATSPPSHNNRDPKAAAIMGRVGNVGLLLPIGIPTVLAGLVYTGHWALHFSWRSYLSEFLTGPGRNSRVLLILFLALNWKSLPLGWTFRILSSFAYHYTLRPPPPHSPRALFHYAITSSRTSPLETDYNLHKSNSTYFSDVDVSRSHLVTHLLGAAIPRLRSESLVRDKSGAPVAGSFGIGLGAVFCSFRRELAPLQKYEMWSRVLAWDRKWLYVVTHFVPAGRVRPTGWDGRDGGRVRRVSDGGEVKEEEMLKYVCATAMSKYVFKMGRFTVHPAIALEAGGMLPERPGGWRSGEDETGGMEELGEVDEEVWDWKCVERERRRGLELAKHFHALDEANALFDGGEDGALGRFPVG